MILHVDMDAFYASVAIRENPYLAGKPVIVAGAGRSVVLSATYEARKQGVSSGMPLGRARRLCPRGVVIPPEPETYGRVSEAIMHVLRGITPQVEPISVDEAFLDISAVAQDERSALALGEHVRSAITDEQEITCSVGIAPVKFVAKIASTSAKPDGICLVSDDAVLPFIHPLPVGRIWGVGEKTQERLTHLGLRTIGDIAHLPRPTLQRAVGHAHGQQLHAFAWGQDPRPVIAHEPERSVGAEVTFERDIDDVEVIKRRLLSLSERTSARLRAQGMAGRTVVVKVRFSDFTTLTRSRTLNEYTDVSREVHEVASKLFDSLGLQRARVRLIGVSVQGLQERARTAWQPQLGEREAGWREADRAMDRARARFGAGAVRPGSLVGALQ